MGPLFLNMEGDTEEFPLNSYTVSVYVIYTFAVTYTGIVIRANVISIQGVDCFAGSQQGGSF